MRDDDYNDSIEFLRQLFLGTEEDVELRALPNGPGRPTVKFTRDPDDVIAFCRINDSHGYGIYFGVCTRSSDGRGGSREFLRELPAFWCEIDTGKFGMSIEDAVAILLSCPLPPSVIVFSGHGLHCYWLLREPYSVTWAPMGIDAEKERVERVTHGLARIFHGDTNACDVTRVLRLVGTHNTKGGEWTLCRVLEASWQRYELEEVEEFAQTCRVLIEAPATGAPAEPGYARVTKSDPEPEDDPFLDYAQAMAMDIEGELAAMKLKDEQKPLHWTRMRAAASLVARGHADEAIFERLMAETQRVVTQAGEAWTPSRERFETKRLNDEIRGAHAKGYAPKPAPSKIVQLRPGQQPAPEAAEAEPAPEFLGYPLNDLGNAARLLAAHAPTIRYVLGIGWHVWDRRRFRHDPEDGRVRRLAHETVKNMLLAVWKSDDTKKSKEKLIKFAVQCANSGRLSNMLHEAKPYQAIEANDLDRDQMLLNCLNGTVRLETGQLQPHAQADLLSKVCGAAYEPDAVCPQWEKFIAEIFGGDMDMVRFIQRGIGYSLTGSTREQVVFILHGSGSNGKSVLIETVQAVLGEYVKRSPGDTWVSKPAGSPTNDLAALVGARLVSVVETEQDRNLAEALVKQATGGDTITARFHRQEFFSFIPQFKLWFATNHRPKIRGTDYAIWRRIYLLPFSVKFVDADKVEGGQRVKDPDLKERLKQEHNGILAWMVRGCLEWQRVGLRPPEAVRLATEAYQDSQDNVAGFVRDCCHQSRGLECATGKLFEAYELWCRETGDEEVSKKAFGGKLDEQGFPPGRRTKTERRRQGIDLTEEYAQKIEHEKAARDGPYPEN
jgi:P4 family phage/plasmid primase-like protien